METLVKTKIRQTLTGWQDIRQRAGPRGYHMLLRSGAAHGFAQAIEWLLIDLEKSGELGEMNYVGSSALDRDWWRIQGADLLQDAWTSDLEHAEGLVNRINTYAEGLEDAIRGT